MYGFDVATFIYTIEEWDQFFKSNPFLKDNNINIKQLCLTFLSEIPSKENIETLNSINFHPDKFILQKKCIYSYYHNGIGRSKMTNNIFERKLKVIATSRNWNTITKLLTLSK